MSTTQIAFTTEKALKQATSKKLKAEWNTLKSFFNNCMQAYLNKEIGFWIIKIEETEWKDFEVNESIENFELFLKKEIKNG